MLKNWVTNDEFQKIPYRVGASRFPAVDGNEVSDGEYDSGVRGNNHKWAALPVTTGSEPDTAGANRGVSEVESTIWRWNYPTEASAGRRHQLLRTLVAPLRTRGAAHTSGQAERKLHPIGNFCCVLVTPTRCDCGLRLSSERLVRQSQVPDDVDDATHASVAVTARRTVCGSRSARKPDHILTLERSPCIDQVRQLPGSSWQGDVELGNTIRCGARANPPRHAGPRPLRRVGQRTSTGGML